MSSEANNDTVDTSASTLSGAEPMSSSTHDESATAAALPSIIVDPSASEPSTQPLASVIIDPTLSEAPSSEASSSDTQAAATKALSSPDDLSDVEADRFADSMRPSWDMATHEVDASWSAPSDVQAATSVSHVPTGRAVAPSNDSDGLPPVVIARGLDKRMLFAVGGGVLLIILALWSMVDSEPEVPPGWNAPASTAPTTPAPSNAPTQEAPAVSSAPTTTPVPPAPVAAVAPTSLPNAVAAIAANSTDTEKPKTVHVRITTTPASAELKLDGETIPNPFDAWVTRGGTHNVVATADGHTTREWAIAFDQDQTLSLVLKREETKRPARRARRPAARSTQSKPRPRGAGFVTDNPY